MKIIEEIKKRAAALEERKAAYDAEKETLKSTIQELATDYNKISEDRENAAKANDQKAFAAANKKAEELSQRLAFYQSRLQHMEETPAMNDEEYERLNAALIEQLEDLAVETADEIVEAYQAINELYNKKLAVVEALIEEGKTLRRLHFTGTALINSFSDLNGYDRKAQKSQLDNAVENFAEKDLSYSAMAGYRRRYEQRHATKIEEE